MSFIDLLSNTIWSESDIINRTEAMIASEFPPTRVNILQRKLQGQIVGQYTLTEQESLDVQHYTQVAYLAGVEADSARADNILLSKTIEYEKAKMRFNLPVVEDSETDVQERLLAKSILESVEQEVIDLCEIRS